MIKEQIHLPDFNMLKQAEDYRVSTTKRMYLKSSENTKIHQRTRKLL